MTETTTEQRSGRPIRVRALRAVSHLGGVRLFWRSMGLRARKRAISVLCLVPVASLCREKMSQKVGTLVKEGPCVPFSHRGGRFKPKWALLTRIEYLPLICLFIYLIIYT